MTTDKGQIPCLTCSGVGVRLPEEKKRVQLRHALQRSTSELGPDSVDHLDDEPVVNSAATISQPRILRVRRLAASSAHHLHCGIPLASFLLSVLRHHIASLDRLCQSHTSAPSYDHDSPKMHYTDTERMRRRTRQELPSRTSIRPIRYRRGRERRPESSRTHPSRSPSSSSTNSSSKCLCR